MSVQTVTKTCNKKETVLFFENKGWKSTKMTFNEYINSTHKKGNNPVT